MTPADDVDVPVLVEFGRHGVHLAGQHPLGEDVVQFRQRFHRLAQLVGIRRDFRRQRRENPLNLLFFLCRPRFQLVAHFHRRHRLDEQRRAGGRLVMHQPRHAAAVLRLDGQAVAVVAHGDNRVLQVLLERG